MVTPEVIILTTFGVASDEKFSKWRYLAGMLGYKSKQFAASKPTKMVYD